VIWWKEALLDIEASWRWRGWLIEVSEAAIVPRGYSPAWPMLTRATFMCAPTGLHWVFGVVRQVWLFFAYAWTPDLLMVPWRAGYDAGRRSRGLQIEAIRESEYWAGFMAGRATLGAQLDLVREEVAALRAEIEREGARP